MDFWGGSEAGSSCHSPCPGRPSFEELKTICSVPFLGQKVMALGTDMGSWAWAGQEELWRRLG